MIDTKTFIRSAYFEEVRGSLAFLKCANPITKTIQLPIGERVCLPTAKRIAKSLDLEVGAVEREINRLLNLRWARKFKEDKKVVFVVGKPSRYFMVEELERKFRGARRKKDGSVQLVEWRWLPLDKWSGTTLWQMIFDKFKERGKGCSTAKAKGRAQMQRLIAEVGVRPAKEVADFFVMNFDVLKLHFKWYGLPNPGLFKTYFHTVKDVKDRGMPQSKNAIHDRGKQTAMATEAIEDWVQF